jgi:hypothetical protein
MFTLLTWLMSVPLTVILLADLTTYVERSPLVDCAVRTSDSLCAVVTASVDSTLWESVSPASVELAVVEELDSSESVVAVVAVVVSDVSVVVESLAVASSVIEDVVVAAAVESSVVSDVWEMADV